jgi:hypothetical protein
VIEAFQWLLFIGACALVIYVAHVATRKAENVRRNSFKHFLPIGGAFKQLK